MATRIGEYCKIILRKVAPESSDVLLLGNVNSVDHTYDELIQDCNRTLAKIAASNNNVNEAVFYYKQSNSLEAAQEAAEYLLSKFFEEE